MRLVAAALAVVLAAAVAEGEEAPSLYDLKAKLQDQSGREVGLDVHRGHPTLIAMFYASCPNACPLLIHDLKQVDAKLPEAARGRVRYLLVSFDPKVDDVPALAAALGKHGLDGARWTLARTSEGSVQEIAAVLDLKFRFLPDGSINHSSAVVLVDGAGRPAARLDGLKQPNDAMVRRIVELAR